jgi:hypothetical protein
MRLLQRMKHFSDLRYLACYLALSLAGSIGFTSYAPAQRPVGDSTTVAEQYLLAAANQERAALGLRPLHRDPLLASAAVQHAERMAEHSGISHQFPGEAELTERAASAGVRFSVVSENVGEAPSAVQIHDMWMHSEGHRTNLLDPAVDAVGISVIPRGRELYAVEDFAKTVQPLSLEQQESAIASLVAQPGVNVIANSDTVSAARRTCAMSTGYAGTQKPWFVMRFTSDSVGVLPAELKTRIASGRYHQAVVGACSTGGDGPFTAYNIAVLLYP